jgi:hypothetical protein
MTKPAAWALASWICLSALAVAQEQVISMEDEPHYSEVFSNGLCRAHIVSLDRLQETKPVVHNHDWVRITLAGTVEQAWGSTLYSKAPYEDPDGYIVSFLYPVSRLSLRNPSNSPYRALVVEIMQGDDSRNRLNDPSLAPFAQTVGPGVDPHQSYVTTLTKTSVEISNVQLLGGNSSEVHSRGTGGLLIATTDLHLMSQQKGAEPKELQLSRGDVQWLSGDAPSFKNLEKTPARFVLLEMR